MISGMRWSMESFPVARGASGGVLTVHPGLGTVTPWTLNATMPYTHELFDLKRIGVIDGFVRMEWAYTDKPPWDADASFLESRSGISTCVVPPVMW